MFFLVMYRQRAIPLLYRGQHVCSKNIWDLCIIFVEAQYTIYVLIKDNLTINEGLKRKEGYGWMDSCWL